MFKQSWIPAWVLIGLGLSGAVAVGCYMQMPQVEPVHIMWILFSNTLVWVGLVLFMIRMGDPKVWAELKATEHQDNMQYAKTVGPTFRKMAKALGVNGNSFDAVLEAFEARLASGRAAEAKLNDRSTQDEIARREARLAELTREQETAQTRLQTVTGQADEKQKELQTARKALQDVQQESGQLSSELGPLRQEVLRARSDKRAAEEAQAAAQQQENAAREELNRLNLLLPELERRASELQPAVTLLEQKLEQLGSAREAAETALRQMAEQQPQLEEILRTLEAQRVELQATVEQLDSEAQALRDTIQELDEARAHEQLTTDELHAERDQLADESAQLQSAIEEARRLLPNLEATVGQLEVQIGTLTFAVNDSETRIAELQETEQRLRLEGLQLAATLAEERQGRVAEQQSHCDLLASMQKLREELAHLESWVDAMRGYRRTLHKKLREVHELHQSAVANCGLIEAQFAGWQESLHLAQEAIDSREANEQAAAEALQKVEAAEKQWRELTDRISRRAASEQFTSQKRKIPHMGQKSKATAPAETCENCVQLTQTLESVERERDQLQLALGSRILAAAAALEPATVLPTTSA